MKNYSLVVNSGNELTLTITSAPEASSLVVTTASDAVDAYDGVTSLREAIAYAQSLGGIQTISFNMSDGDTVTISDPELIYRDLRFASTNEATGNAVTVTLDNLSISERSYGTSYGSGVGGCIIRFDDINVVVSGGEYSNNDENRACDFGGALQITGNNATLTVDGVTFNSNQAFCCGGAINVEYATFTVRNSHFEGNSVNGQGGALNLFVTPDVHIIDTDFVDNSTGNSWAWCGGAIALERGNLLYEVTADKTITNVGNFSCLGGFITLRIQDDVTPPESTAEFRVNGTLNIGNGDGKDSIASYTPHSNVPHTVFIRKTGTGTMTINAPTSDYDKSWFIEDGVLAFTYAQGGDFDGDITISGGQMQLAASYTFNKLTFDLSAPNQTVYLDNVANLTGGSFVADATEATNGIYMLAGNAGGFNSAVSLKLGEETYANALTLGDTYTVGGKDYSLVVNSSNELTLTVSPVVTAVISDQVIENETVTVHAGEVYSNTAVYSEGHFHVSSDGQADYTRVSGYEGESGAMYVSEGATANWTIVDSYGKLAVTDGGVANDTTINCYADMYVSSGGVANRTSNLGYMDISDGGVANSVTIASYGRLFVFEGGTANDVIVKSPSYSEKGLYIVGGVVNRVTVSNGSMYVSNGGVVNSVTISSGYVYVSNGGVVNSAIISSGYAYVSGGGEINNLTFSSGYLSVYSGGTANSAMITYRGVVYLDRGGVMNDTVVTNKGSMYVSSSGVVTDITVTSSGYLHVSSGGTATGIVVSDGGRFTFAVAPNTYVQWKRDGSSYEMTDGTLSDYNVHDGSLYVFGGGSAENMTVGSWGMIYVSSNGVVNDVTINHAGWEKGATVYSGGTMNRVTVNNGGSVFISSGGTVTDIVENGGEVKMSGAVTVNFIPNVFSDLIVKPYANVTVHSGTTAVDVKLDGGWFYIYDEGIANRVNVDNGALFISSGGTANSAIIRSNGSTQEIDVGGITSVASASGGSMHLYYRGLADSATVTDGGRMYVSSGGTARNTLVGGDPNDETISAYGKMYVSEGGMASDTTISGLGSVYVSSAGSVAGATIVNSGFLEIASGGSASGVEISEGGSLSFVVAASTYVQGSRGGSSFEMTNGTLSDYTVMNGHLQVSSGGTVNNLVLSTDGTLDVYSGGVANSTTVNSNTWFAVGSGGIANNTTINTGHFYVYDGSVANGVTISAGNLSISNGGVVNGASISADGYIYVYTGGKLTGSVQIQAGAVVNLEDNAIIDFNISQLQPGNTALFNDLSFASEANVDYKLTISVEGEEGTYVLAEGADWFDNEITLQGTTGEAVGTLTVGGDALELGGSTYSLNLSNNGTLSVSVAHNQTIYDRIYLDPLFTEESVAGVVLNGDELVWDKNAFSVSNINRAVFVTPEGGDLYVNGLSTSITVNKHVNLHLTNSASPVLSIGPNSASGSTTGNVNVTINNSTVAKGDSYVVGNMGTCDGNITVTVDGSVIGDGGSTKEFRLANDMTLTGNSQTVSLTVLNTTLCDDINLLSHSTFGSAGSPATVTLTLDNVYAPRDKWIWVSNGDRNGTSYGNITFNISNSVLGNDGNMGIAPINAHDTSYYDRNVGNVTFNIANTFINGRITPNITDGYKTGLDKSGTYTANIQAGYSYIISVRGFDVINVAAGAFLSVDRIEYDGTLNIAGKFVFNAGYASEEKYSNSAEWNVEEVNLISGGTISGPIHIGEGTTLTVEAGSVVDFDIAGRNSGYDLRVWNISMFYAANFELTVSGLQDNGSYTLATGAESFNKTITVRSADRSAANNGILGTISVGETKTFQGKEYSLYLAATDSESPADRLILNVSGTGSASKETVYAHRRINVQDGETADSMTVLKSSYLNVSSGGTATNLIADGGVVRILSGGLAEDVYMSGGFYTSMVIVEKGGVLSGVSVVDAADLIVSGAAYNVVLTGDKPYSGTNLDYSDLYLENGGYAENVTANSGSYIIVHSTSVLKNAFIDSCVRFTISSGGKVTGEFSLSNGAEMSIGSGAIAEFDISSRAAGASVLMTNLAPMYSSGFVFTLLVSDSQASGTYLLGGHATGFNKTISVRNTLGEYITTLSAGDHVKVGNVDYTLNLEDDVLSLTVKAPRNVNNYVVENETVSILADEVYSHTTVNDLGNLLVSSGGIARDTAVNASGTIIVSSGGVADGATVNSSGNMHISEGGVAMNVRTDSYGYVYVSSGGLLLDLYASGGYYEDGSVFVLAGGIVSSALIDNGVCLAVSGFAYDVVLSGRNPDYPGGYQDMDNSDLFLYGGGYAENVRVESDGNYRVFTGATANGFIVSSGGTMWVKPGGKMTGQMTIENGANVDVQFYGTGAVIDFDVSEVGPGSAPRLNDLSLVTGWNTANFTLTVSGTQGNGTYALAGGAADFNKTITVQNTLGTTLRTLTLGADPVEINGANYSLAVSGSTLNLTITGGTRLVSGRVIENETVSVLDGETYINTTINSNGNLLVSSGGIASDTTVNWDGFLHVSNGGIASGVSTTSMGFVRVSSGGLLLDGHFEGGYAEEVVLVYQGGVASSVDILDGVNMEVYGSVYNAYMNDYRHDGNLSDLYIHNGGYAENITVGHNGNFRLYEGSFGKNITVNGGYNEDVWGHQWGLRVYGSATAQNVTVGEDGEVFVEYNGKLTGRITFSDGSLVEMYDGSILEFDLTQTSPDSQALVNNFNHIQGNPNCQITVGSDGQAYGNYALADGADGFNSTITIRNTDGAMLGTISVGETVVVGNDQYTLNLSGESLSLTISDAGIMPSPSTLDDLLDPLVVTTALDVVDANDGQISLREAIAYANNWSAGSVITFADDFTIELGDTLTVSQDIVIDGGDKAITIIGSDSARMFDVTGNGMTLKNMTLSTDYTGAGAGIADVTTGKIIKLYTVADGGNAGLLWSVSGNTEIWAYDSSLVHRAIVVTDTSVWGTGQIQMFSGSILDNASVTGQQLRDGGDIKVFGGGELRNVTAKDLGDIYVYGGVGEGLHAESNAMVRQYADTTVNGMVIDFGGIYVYDSGAILTGTISIAGTAKAYTSGSVAADTADLVFDLTARTGDSSFTFTHAHPDTASVWDCQLLIDDMNAFLGAGSYTINVNADQAYGTYLLAGNAANFNAATSLKIGDVTYENMLPVGGAIAISGRVYALSLDDSNNLTLSIAEGSGSGAGGSGYSNTTYTGYRFTGSYQSGAAIQSNTDIAVTNCNFINNGNYDENGNYRYIYGTWGGAISVNDQDLVEITGCIFTNNYAFHAGALSFIGDKVIHITDSTFTGNKATQIAGAILLQGYGLECVYTVTSGHNIVNTGNDAWYGGFVSTHNGEIELIFDVESNATLTIGEVSTSIDTINLGKGSRMTKRGDGVMTVNSPITQGSPYGGQTQIVGSDIVVEAGTLQLTHGGSFNGVIEVHSGAQLDLDAQYSFTTVKLVLDEPTAIPMISDIAQLSSGTAITVDATNAQLYTPYLLAGNAENYSKSLTLTVGDNNYGNVLTLGETYAAGDLKYTLALDNDYNMTLTVTEANPLDPLVVTTALDVVDASDGVISLREAVANAQAMGGKQTISFNISGEDTVVLRSALNVDSSIVVDGVNAATGNNVIVRAEVTYAEAQAQATTASDYSLFVLGDGDFTMKNMTIMGGQASAVRKEEGLAGDLTVLNVTARDSYKAFYVYAENATVDGFYGFNNIEGENFGHVILVTNSTFENYDTVSANTDNGGFIRNFGAGVYMNLTVINSTFLNNEAPHSGAAFYMDTNNAATLVNCTIENSLGHLWYGNALCSVRGGSFKLLNTIVVTPDNWAQPDIGAAFSGSNLVRYSVFGSSGSATTVTNSFSGYNSEDLFVTPGETDDNGGRTPTITLRSDADVLDNAALAAYDPETRNLYYSTDNGATWKNYYDGSDATVEAAWIIDTDQNGNSRLNGSNKIGASLNTADVEIETPSVPPQKPVVSADFTEPTNHDVTVFAVFSEDTVEKEYSLDGQNWQTYTKSIAFSDNGTIFFRAKNSAGLVSEIAEYNVTNIDKIAPNAPQIAANITSPTNSAVSVSAVFSADSDVKEYSLDGQNWNEYKNAIVFTENGTIFFRGIDSAGNMSSVASYRVSNIDRTAPESPIASADVTEPTNSAVTVSATFSPDSVSREYSFDGRNWKAYFGPLSFTDNGTVYFRSADAAGNVSETTSYTVSNIDTVAPEKPVASADITVPTNSVVLVSANFNANAVTNEYSLNGTDWQYYMGSIEFTENGTVYFRSIDAANNISEVTSYTVSNIDTVAPDRPAVLVDVTSPTRSNVVVAASFDNDSVVREYSLNGGSWKTYSGSIQFQENGTVSFRGTDAAGNTSDVATYDVTNIDRVAPDQPVITVTPTNPTNAAVLVSAEFAADALNPRYSFDGQTWLSYEAPIVFMENGPIMFLCNDEAGNMSFTSYMVTNIDRLPPERPIATASTTVPTSRDVAVTAMFSGDSILRQYSLDGLSWLNYTAPVILSENGTVFFRGTDAAGNASQITSCTVDNIDKTAPVITLTGDTTANSSTVLTAATEAGVTLFYSVDNNNWIQYNGELTVSGNATYYFRGTDAAGNTGTAFMTFNNFDFIAPEITGVSMTQGEGNYVLTAAVSATDDRTAASGLTYRIRYAETAEALADAEVINGTSITLSQQNAGRMLYYQVCAVDAAGNAAWSSVKTFNVSDVTAPVLNDVPTAVFRNNSIVFNWNAASDNVGVAGYHLTVNGTTYNVNGTSFVLNNVGAGNYQYSLSAYDDAGNETSGGTQNLTVGALADLTPNKLRVRDRNNKLVTTVYLDPTTHHLEMNFSIQIKNIGAVKADSSKATIMCGETVLGTVLVAEINPNRSVTAYWHYDSSNPNVPVLTTGMHDIYVCVNSGDTPLAEYDETNNIMHFMLNVEDSIPDLTVGSIGMEQEVYEKGLNPQLSFSVKNIGNADLDATDEVLVDIYVDGDCVHSIALASDELNSVQTVSLPGTGLGLGRHTVSIVVNQEEDIDESDCENNVASTTFTVGASDLNISKVSIAESDVTADSPFTVNFTVRNSGSAGAGAPSVAKLYDGDTLLGSVDVESLGVGLSVVKQITVEAGALSVGRHNLRVVVDANNAVEELDEMNNARAISVDVKDNTAPEFTGGIGISQNVNGYRFTVTATASDSITAAADLVYGVRVAETADALSSAEAVNGLIFTLAPEDAGKTLYYQVSATDEAGNTVWSDAQAFTVKDRTAPEFQNVSVSISDMTLNLSWTASDNIAVSGYGIYFDDVQVAFQTEDTFAFDITEVGTHTYRIEAFDAAGNIVSTGNSEIDVNDTVAPTFDAISVRQEANSYNMAFTVLAQDNVNSPADIVCRVKYAFDENEVAGATAGALNFTITPDKAGQTLYYIVSATDASGNTAESGIQSLVIRDVTAPDAPAGLAGIVNNADASFSWSASNDNVAVSGYLFRYGAAPELAGTGIEVNANQYAMTDLQSGVYYWQVASFDAAGNQSAWSDVQRFRILPADPYETENSYDLGTLSGEQSWSGGAVSTASDEDWYRFTLSSKGSANDYVQISFDGMEGDLDLYLYASNGTTLLATANAAAGGTETISLKGIAKGTYLVKVVGKDGAMNDYTLSTKKVAAYDMDIYDERGYFSAGDDQAGAETDLPEGGNNTIDTATVFNVTDTPQNTIEGLNIHQADQGNLAADVDFYQFKLSNMGVDGDQVSISFENAAGDLDLWLYDGNDPVNPILKSDGIGNTETISFKGLAAGNYYIEVKGAFGNVVNEYTMSWNFTPNEIMADTFEGFEPIVFTESAEITNLTIHDELLGGTREDTFSFVLEQDGSASSKVRFTNYRGDWNGLKYTLVDGDSNVVFSGVGSEISLEGLTAGNYTLTVDAPFAGSYSGYDISVSLPEAAKQKWTYMVYMAADNDLEPYALYDLIAMQQAKLNAEIDIYVLVDRNKNSLDNTTRQGYLWDSSWTDTRVGKITYSQGKNVAVEWESWGELCSSNIDTLGRFIEWTTAQSDAENYGLVMWDHGRENGTLCFDATGAVDCTCHGYISVSEIANLLKNTEANIPLVVFNNCLLGSELVATQMAGSTQVIVVSEADSMPEDTTYTYRKFFSEISSGMNAREMADVLVKNVKPHQGGIVSTLASVDVTLAQDGSDRLSDALKCLANAVSAANNVNDQRALIDGFQAAMQDGCAYDGVYVYQSDLYDAIARAQSSRYFSQTSAAFRTALSALKDTLDEVILNAKSLPANQGYGIAVFNPVLTARHRSTDIGNYLASTYADMPEWSNLLLTLARTYRRTFYPTFSGSKTGNFDVLNVFDPQTSQVVSVLDLGCFSGGGLTLDGIDLFDELYCSITLTEDVAANSDYAVAVSNADGVTIALFSDDWTSVGTVSNGTISLAGLEAGEYLIKFSTDTARSISLTYTATDLSTGVDRFDYGNSKMNSSSANGNGSASKANATPTGYYSGLFTCGNDEDWYRIGNGFAENDEYEVVVTGPEGLSVSNGDSDPVVYDPMTGTYTLMMKSGDNLRVLGVGNAAQAYSFEVNRAAFSTATVGFGETLTVGNADIAVGVSVEAGGTLTVEAGGTLSGNIVIAEGATVSIAEGAYVSFNITSTETGNTAFINDLSLLTGWGNADYQLVLSASSQGTGTYNLAANASAFNKSITVKDDAFNELGTLSVGGVLLAGGKSYALGLADGTLSLTVGSIASSANEISNIASDPGISAVTISSGSFKDTVAVLSCKTGTIMGDNDGRTMMRTVYGGVRAGAPAGYEDEPVVRNIDLSIEGGTFSNIVVGGSSIGMASRSRQYFATGDIQQLTISDGLFIGNVTAGDRFVKGYFERQGDIVMDITGGTFKAFVNAGLYNAATNPDDGTAYLIGDVYLNVTGGTFEEGSWLFGGSLSGRKEKNRSTMAKIVGNVTITVDTSFATAEKPITLTNIVAGSNGWGTIIADSKRTGVETGNTKLVFTGNNDSIVFQSDSLLWGSSSGDRVNSEGKIEPNDVSVTGKRILSFTGFTCRKSDDTLGTLGCSSIAAFSHIEFKSKDSVDSDVGLKSSIDLSGIENWEFECGSKLSGSFKNNFAGDTLNLVDFTEVTTPQLLMRDTDNGDARNVFNGFGSSTFKIQMGGVAVTSQKFSDNTWTFVAGGSNYSLGLSSNGTETDLILSKLA